MTTQTATVDTLTPADLHAIITDRLNRWNRRIRVDIGVNGHRLHIAELGASMYIEFIAVPPTQRRGGYGTAMLTAVTEWADRSGLRLELGVSDEYGVSRPTLTRLYQAHGFEPQGRVGMVRQPAVTATH